MKGFLIAVVVVGSVACSSDETRPPAEADATAATCTGPCFDGDWFSQCTGGGDGEDRLACNGADCRWFVDGCVPEGFVASDCPADDICCHDGWPYGDEVSERDVDLYLAFYGFGTSPWDGTTALDVAVEVDDTISAVETSFSCSGPELGFGGQSPCNAAPSTSTAGATLRDTLVAVTRSTEASFGGWYPWVEIVPDDPTDPAADPLRARLCAIHFTDAIGPTCPSREQAVCATSGSVTLNRWPTSDTELSGLAIDVDVAFENGFAMSGTMVVD